MSSTNLHVSPKDDKNCLNLLLKTDVVELLLVSKSFVLECWAAEEYALKNGKAKKKSARSLLSGALVRIAATGLLAQITYGDQNSKGRRVLEFQNFKPTSIHDIMDHPWPEDTASKKVFKKALTEGLSLHRIKAMNVAQVATTLHRLEQAKYWSGLRQRHNSQNLSGRQRSAVEGQMADCMRSTDAPPAAELVAMVQAGCEEEEPGEVSEGRRALQRHLQEVKDRQQASHARQAPATAARSRNKSAGSSPDKQSAHQPKAKASLPSTSHIKATGDSSTKGDRSEAGAGARQEGSAPSPLSSSIVWVTVTRASECPGKSEVLVDKCDKAHVDARVQTQPSAWRGQQSGEDTHSTPGRGELLPGGGRPWTQADFSAAAACEQRRPSSASTPGKPLPGILPANGPGTTAEHAATHAASAVASRATPQPDALQRASKHEPVAESPGIITSATIARLASHSAAQQPLNSKPSTRQQAPRGRAAPAYTAAGKRKSTDTHQLRTDSDGQAHPSNPSLPSSQAPSPSSSSPEQPTGGKRKKILWDPQVAFSQPATGTAITQAQQPSPSNHLHPPAAGHVQGKQSAPTALTTSLNLKSAPSSAWVHPSFRVQETPRVAAKAADEQLDKPGVGEEEVGRSAGGGSEQAGPEVGVQWSWGPGAAVQGHFDAALVSMMHEDQKSGDSIQPCELTFSSIVHLETQEQQLASTTCNGVHLMHCKGQRFCGGHKATDPSECAVNDTLYPGGYSVEAVNSLMDHARLCGCLESSGAALAFCGASESSIHQRYVGPMASEAYAETDHEGAAASKHKQPDKQPAGVPDFQPQQLGAAPDKSTFTKASSIEAAKSLDRLTNDLIQACVENATTAQLQACMENAQRMEDCTGALTQASGSQSGAMQAGPKPSASAAQGNRTQAAAADSEQAGSLLQDLFASTSQASDALPQVGMLLVSGRNVRQWLAATNMSEQPLEHSAASCAANSCAIYALILLHTPSYPTHAPSSTPVTTPGQPSSSLLGIQSWPHLCSDAFPLPPSWVVPLNSMSDSLQQIIRGSLEDGQHDIHATGRNLTPPNAVDTSQNALQHTGVSPRPADPLHPLATSVVTTYAAEQHQPPNQLHRQAGPPMPGSCSTHQNPPKSITSQDHLCQAGTELEQKQKCGGDRNSAGQAGSWSAEEGQLRDGQLREGQLRSTSKLKKSISDGKAEQQRQQQQQQQATISPEELQQPVLIRPRLHRQPSDTPHDDSAGQPAPSATGAVLIRPPPQQPAVHASTVASPQKPGQTVVPNPNQSVSEIAKARPDPSRARASDVIADSDLHTLRQSSPGGQLQPGYVASEPEPPSRGKRTEEEEGVPVLDSSVSQLVSGKPRLQGRTPSPAVSKGAATIGQTSDAAAAKAFSGKPAAQPLASRASTSSAVTGDATAAADASQLPADGRTGAASPVLPEKQAQPSSQALAHAVPQSKPKQKKRIYRQPSTAETSPEAKRQKQAAPGKEVRVKSETASPNPQQQQQRQEQHQGKDAKAAVFLPRKVREPIRHPEQPINLPPSAVENIYRSMRKLRLLGKGQQLSSQDMNLMAHLPPLVQLRVLSKYASEVLPNGNVVKFFSLTVEAMGRRSRDSKWLAQRDETATAYRLCDAAASLYGQLGECGELPENTVPTKTPQLVPLELQAAYILCIGGYSGLLSRKEFADQLMIGLLGQVYMMMEELKASESDCKTAELNLKAAGGSPAKVHERLRQPSATRSEPQRAQHATRASEAQRALHATNQLNIRSAVRACFGGMIRLRHIKDGEIDDKGMNFLESQGALWQLRIVSMFGCNLKRPSPNASAFLMSTCKLNRNDRQANKLDWLRHMSRQLHSKAQSVLDQAYSAGLLLRSKQAPAKIAVLPTDLHYAAVCYAIGAHSSDKFGDHVPAVVVYQTLSDFIRYAQGLILEVHPAAVPNHSTVTSALASRPASRAASLAPRDDQSNRTAVSQRAPTPVTHPALSDPRTRPPSQPPHPQASASQHQTSSVQGQPHMLHTGIQSRNHPRHCKYFYRIEAGCTNRNCEYYHGSHQEYVAYMVHVGLVPYSLKFASDVGRDRWIVDAAVDGLNDMILSQQVPRGSFSECDLRPLAFLQDPNGEHARMQLQVVQRMAERIPTSNPAQLLQSTCQQVQTQAQTGSGGYSSMSEGYSQGPSEAFGSRSMIPIPEDLARTSSSMPQAPFANAQMFRGPADFTPSPAAPPLLPLPLSLPFAPAPLPPEDPADADIPFPVLRYEEELLAGMLVLQDQEGAVDSVDQLLALQPQCSMPPELARHFQGDMRERVQSFLQTRPWLFGVSPHGGISVTRLAREGLIYKRDVITYLYNAFIDNTSHVTLTEISDCVAQPPGMQQVMMENNGLLGLMDTQLFRDDVMLQPGPFGPQDIRVVLRSSGV